MPLQFRKASWSAEKIKECEHTLNELFFAAVGKGEKRMNPHAVDVINRDRVDIAETIINLVEQNIALTDPLPFLVTETEGDIRNEYVWQEMDSTLRVVQRSYGSKPISQRMTFKEVAMSTTQKEVNVEIPLEEVFSGRQTPSLAASEMALAVARYRVANTLDLVDAAVPTSTTDRTGISGYTLRYVEGTNVTQANLDKAINGLVDQGDAVAIIGRFIAFGPAMQSFTGWTAVANGAPGSVQDDIVRRGVIAQYRGANVVALKDPVLRRIGEHLIRKDRIYIAGSSKGAIYMTKPVEFLNYAFADAKTAVFSTGFRLEDGVLMYDPYGYRIIEVNPT